MKRVFPLLLILPLLVSVPAVAQYSVPHGTFSCGGTVRSGSYYNYDTVGQAAASTMSGASYQARLGFWYMAGLESAVDVAILSFEGRYEDDAVRLSWRADIDTPFD
ncbi:MAG: hypothetical protein GF417_03390, partial [Candidatus Latescibacteria bacterium]|nr:hypothetical protein [bacterium]MBD3423472.1 hypothetical protein [Candidatus Latescibacterota bacterium]